MISQGTHRARATTMAYITSSKKGTPAVEVVFSITDGPDKGANIAWQGWLTDGTRVRTAESLEACGFDGEDEKTVTKNEVYLVVDHEEYEGKTRAKIAWVNDISRGPGSSPMDAAKAADFKADLRGLIMAKKAAAQGATPASASANGGSEQVKPKF